MKVFEEFAGEVIKHAIQEQESSSSIYYEELIRTGVTVLPSGFTEEQINRLKDKVKLVYQKQILEIDQESLALIGDENVVRSLLEYDSTFLDLVFEANLINFVQEIFKGLFVLIYQNGVFNYPEQNKQELYKWHRDLNYQHWVASKPLAINALLCLDHFDEHTGGTEFLPNSHMFEKFPSNQFVIRNKTQVKAKPGDWIVMNSMLFHKTGVNNTSNPRFGVNQMFAVPFVNQYISLGNHFTHNKLSKYIDSYGEDFVGAVLGETWKSADSAYDWRMNKINKVLGSNK